MPGDPATINGVAAGGDLTGTYPAPTVAPGAVAPTELGVVPPVRITGSNSNPACFDRQDSASATLATFVNATCVVRLDAGAFVTTTVTQTSGGALGFNGFESASLSYLGKLF